jgi:hypothetical protein
MVCILENMPSPSPPHAANVIYGEAGGGGGEYGFRTFIETPGVNITKQEMVLKIG